jgi:glycogen(starch) synthase
MPVTFAGQVMPSSVVHYLQQARLLVMPSYRGDGLPNVILEAMACGVPVVATDTAGIPDCVRDGETGLLFHPGDVEQMATHIDRVFTDNGLWRQLGTCSLKAVESNSWELIAPQIEEVLAEATTG